MDKVVEIFVSFFSFFNRSVVGIAGRAGCAFIAAANCVGHARGHILSGEQFQRQAAEAQESADILRSLITQVSAASPSDDPVPPSDVTAAAD